MGRVKQFFTGTGKAVGRGLRTTGQAAKTIGYYGGAAGYKIAKVGLRAGRKYGPKVARGVQVAAKNAPRITYAGARAAGVFVGSVKKEYGPNTKAGKRLRRGVRVVKGKYSRVRKVTTVRDFIGGSSNVKFSGDKKKGRPPTLRDVLG